MASPDTTRLEVARREPAGSRATRRLRRTGLVPGVVYGGTGEAVAFSVGERELRQALAHAGAVLELCIDGDDVQPVLVKDRQRHHIREGETVHVDFLRVRMDRAIQTTVVLELEGAEESPGVTDGGVLDQVTRELNIEALPGDIPDSIVFDVSGMEMNETLQLSAITAPSGVTLLDDPEETTIATLSPPRVEVEETEVEEETELVGEDGEPVEGAPAAEGDAAEGAGGTDAAEGGE